MTNLISAFFWCMRLNDRRNSQWGMCTVSINDQLKWSIMNLSRHQGLSIVVSCQRGTLNSTPWWHIKTHYSNWCVACAWNGGCAPGHVGMIVHVLLSWRVPSKAMRCWTNSWFNEMNVWLLSTVKSGWVLLFFRFWTCDMTWLKRRKSPQCCLCLASDFSSQNEEVGPST
jgi:hypothetical protein